MACGESDILVYIVHVCNSRVFLLVLGAKNVVYHIDRLFLKHKHMLFVCY